MFVFYNFCINKTAQGRKLVNGLLVQTWLYMNIFLIIVQIWTPFFEPRFGHVAVNCKVFFSHEIKYILVVILSPILSPLTFMTPLYSLSRKEDEIRRSMRPKQQQPPPRLPAATSRPPGSAGPASKSEKTASSSSTQVIYQGVLTSGRFSLTTDLFRQILINMEFHHK